MTEEYIGYVTSHIDEIGVRKSFTLYHENSLSGFLQGEEVFEVKGKRFTLGTNWFRGGCRYKNLNEFQKAIDWFHKGSPKHLEARLRKFCDENKLILTRMENVPKSVSSLS